MKRILLTLSMIAFISTAGVSMAQTPKPPYEQKLDISKTETKPGMEKIAMRRSVIVTIEGPAMAMKERRYVNIAGREVEVTGRKVTLELTPEEIYKLHEKREVGFGEKGFLRNCHKLTVTRTEKPSETVGVGAEVFIKLGVKRENGMEKPFCDHADIKIFKVAGKP
jgi:hypothetical protein